MYGCVNNTNVAAGKGGVNLNQYVYSQVTKAKLVTNTVQ